MLILLPNINTMHGKSLAIEEKIYVEFTTGISVLRSSSSEPKQIVGKCSPVCTVYVVVWARGQRISYQTDLVIMCTTTVNQNRWTRKYMIRKIQKTNPNSEISLYFSKSLEFLIVWGNCPCRPSCLEANKLILHTLCKPPEPPSFWAISISQQSDRLVKYL